MRVIATRQGFLGSQLREPGDEMQITADQFSPRWMEEVKAAKPRGRKISDPAPGADGEGPEISEIDDA